MGTQQGTGGQPALQMTQVMETALIWWLHLLLVQLKVDLRIVAFMSPFKSVGSLTLADPKLRWKPELGLRHTFSNVF